MRVITNLKYFIQTDVVIFTFHKFKYYGEIKYINVWLRVININKEKKLYLYHIINYTKNIQNWFLD